MKLPDENDQTVLTSVIHERRGKPDRKDEDREAPMEQEGECIVLKGSHGHGPP
jgi:hypothetical protein